MCQHDPTRMTSPPPLLPSRSHTDTDTHDHIAYGDTFAPLSGRADVSTNLAIGKKKIIYISITCLLSSVLRDMREQPREVAKPGAGHLTMNPYGFYNTNNSVIVFDYPGLIFLINDQTRSKRLKKKSDLMFSDFVHESSNRIEVE